MWQRGMFLLLLLFSSTECLAAFGNYNSILIGDQAAGMGGAATAVADDNAAAPWYNPAALGAIPGQSFSAAVGIYKKFETQYGQSEDLVSSALRVNQGFFRALPSSTSSVIRPQHEFFRGWTLAMSILVPEFDQFRGEVNHTEINTSVLTTTDESLWVGGSAAKEIASGEFVGFSLYYAARSMNKTVDDRTYRSPTDFQIFTENRALTQNAMVFVTGYLRQLNEHWSVGASLRFPSLHIMGRGSYLANNFRAGQAEQPITLNELDSKSRIPARLNLGAAYRDAGKLLVALDVNAHSGESYEDLQSSRTGVAESYEHLPLLNVSLGAEYQWTQWLRTRFGFFTNFSSHPKPDPNRVGSQGDHVDQLGFSANMAFRSGAIEYTFGGYYSGGRGESVQRLDHQYRVIEKNQNIFTMLVGTSYYF